MILVINQLDFASLVPKIKYEDTAPDRSARSILESPTLAEIEPELGELGELHDEIASRFPIPSLPQVIPPSLHTHFCQYPHDFDGIKERKKHQIKALLSSL